MNYFEIQLEKQRQADDGTTQKDEAEATNEVDRLPERKKYEQLCRGEGVKMVRTTAHTRTHARTHTRTQQKKRFILG